MGISRTDKMADLGGGSHVGSHVMRSPPPPSRDKCFLTLPQHSHLILTQLNIQRHYGVFCDVIIRIDKYDFKAHKCVLAAGAPKLQDMFHNMPPDFIIPLKDISVVGFEHILEFLYTGTLQLKDINLQSILSAAQYLGVRDVEKMCLEYQYNKGVTNSESQGTHLGKDGTSMAENATLRLENGNPQTQNYHHGYSKGCMTGQVLPMFPPPGVNLENSNIEEYFQLIEPPGGGYGGYASPRHGPRESCALSVKSTRTNSGTNVASQTEPATKEAAESNGDITKNDLCEGGTVASKDDTSFTENSGEDSPRNRQKRKTAVPIKLTKEEEYDFEANMLAEEHEAVMPVRRRGRPKKPQVTMVAEESNNTDLLEDHQEVINVENGPDNDDNDGDDNDDDDVFEKTMKKKRGRPRKAEERSKTEKIINIIKPRGRKPGVRSKIAKLRRTCPDCGRQFARRKALEKHMELHNSDELYSCNICNMQFPRLAELTRHSRLHTKQNFVCKYCDSEFEDPKCYKKHVHEVHNDPKPFCCTYDGCKYAGEKLSDLTRHIPIHSGDKSFICNKCGKAFAQSNGLWHHRRSCTKPHSYQCDVCGSRFNHLQTLKGHMLVHSGEKPYQCADCGARFRDRNNYRRHLQIHDKTFPYGCSRCDKRFRHSNSLKQHMRQHDTEKAVHTTRNVKKEQERQQKQQSGTVQLTKHPGHLEKALPGEATPHILDAMYHPGHVSVGVMLPTLPPQPQQSTHHPPPPHPPTIQHHSNLIHSNNLSHPSTSHETTYSHPSTSHITTLSHPPTSHITTLSHPPTSHITTLSHPPTSHITTLSHPPTSHITTLSHPPTSHIATHAPATSQLAQVPHPSSLPSTIASLQGGLPPPHPNMLQNPNLFTPVPMIPHINQYSFPGIDMRNCPPPPGM